MNDRIQQAFDQIKAEETLKEKTVQLIYSQKKKGVRKIRTTYHSAGRMAAVFASFFILILIGGISYRVYATPQAYVDVDVNPSIELTINRFDRVIGVFAYNDDGEKVLSQVSLRNKTSKEALDLLLTVIEKEGYMEKSELLSITVQSDGQQQSLVDSLQEHVSCTVGTHHSNMMQEVFAVDKQTKKHAHDMGVSPAQYLALMALKQADPSIDVKECQDHSISELRNYANEHHSDHHSGDGSGGSTLKEEETPENDAQGAAEQQNTSQAKHHEEGDNKDADGHGGHHNE